MTIKEKENIEVRGEIYMPKKSLDSRVGVLEYLSEQEYACGIYKNDNKNTLRFCEREFAGSERVAVLFNIKSLPNRQSSSSSTTWP